MNAFKRVIAVIVGILAVAGVAAMAVAIFGTWSINNQLTDLSEGLLGRAENGVDAVVTVVGQIDDDLARVEDRLDAAETAVNSLAADAAENRIVINLISDLLGVELGSRAQKVAGAVDKVQSTAESIDSMIQTVDALPFVSILESRPRLEVFGEIADAVGGFQSDVEEAQDAVQTRREEIAQGAASIVTTRTSKLTNRIDKLQLLLAGVTNQLDGLKQKLQSIQQDFARTLDMVSFVLSLVFLFIAFAFLSLLTHSISLFRRPEQTFRELVGWAGEEAGGEADEEIDE